MYSNETNEKVESFPCEQCGKSFNSSDEVSDHVIVKHVGVVKPRYCVFNQCKAKSFSMETLIYHIWVAHNTDIKRRVNETYNWQSIL